MLFKQIVGETVLAVTNSTAAGRTVRVYAFCARTSGPLAYPAGSIAIVAINVNNASVSFDVNVSGATVGVREEYHLTAPGGNMGSLSIELNGQVLELGAGGTLPAFVPVEVEDGASAIQMSALSYGFIVLKSANAAACL